MMPVLFVGHGSPMNAIEENRFTKMLTAWGSRIVQEAKPKAILCISAHWLTKGSFVTGMKSPKTIHDFYGFPKALFEVQYPASGSPETAKRVQTAVSSSQPVTIDMDQWGLDHGTWSVLRHLFPKADIPVVQLSIDFPKTEAHHFSIGEKLRALRKEGVLIVGSGNIVHNLAEINFDAKTSGYDWALEFDEKVKGLLLNRDFAALNTIATDSAAGKLSVPNPDHWYPLFYALGASDKKDDLRFEYEGLELGSVSMRCLSFD